MSPAPRNQSFVRLSLAIVLLSVFATAPLRAASNCALPQSAQSNSAALNQILLENAAFFSMLVTFSYTAAIAEPAWGIDVTDINLNLITRAVRDAQGHQLIRVRVAGVVRKNNNVELNILNPKGELVGKGFFGFYSGQLTFYDPNDRPIVDGYMDSDGYYALDDVRLPHGLPNLASGYLDTCFDCDSLGYAWYKGQNIQVGGGWMYPSFYYDEYSVDRARIYWTFEKGRIADNVPATGEAEYDLAGEATGAINSALFDTDRTAESFFADPRSLVPEPVGRALLPRFTNNTGVAVTNVSGRQINVTFAVRHPDGSLVTGDGIENPVTYVFAKGQQFAAYPEEIFRRLDPNDRRPVLADGSVAWMEVYSDEGEVQAMYLDGSRDGSELDGNVGVRSGADPIVFADIRTRPDESTEIELLNLAYDDVIVRLQLLDGDGAILREESEFFIAGYGMRNFSIGGGSDFLRVGDPSLAASLRVTCNNVNSIKSSSCSKIIGLASYKDRFGSLASGYAVSSDSAGSALVGPHFVSGLSGGGSWETTVHVAKLNGGMDSVYLDLFDSRARLLATLPKQMAAGGAADFHLNGSTLPWGDQFSSGYVRLRSGSGLIAGVVSLSWSDGNRSQFTEYPLANDLHRTLQFNQVVEGRSAELEYWTGIALVNDLDTPVQVAVQIFRPDGTADRSTEITLNPSGQWVSLLSEMLKDPLYTRIGGYLRVTSTDPISAIVLYGDSSGRFLAAIPGIPD